MYLLGSTLSFLDAWELHRQVRNVSRAYRSAAVAPLKFMMATRPGRRVKLTGLKGAAHLNDREGHVVSPDNPLRVAELLAKGRVTVRVSGEQEDQPGAPAAGTGAPIAIRMANIIILDPVPCPPFLRPSRLQELYGLAMESKLVEVAKLREAHQDGVVQRGAPAALALEWKCCRCDRAVVFSGQERTWTLARRQMMGAAILLECLECCQLAATEARFGPFRTQNGPCYDEGLVCRSGASVEEKEGSGRYFHAFLHDHYRDAEDVLTIISGRNMLL